MWLETQSTRHIVHLDSSDYVVPWRVDVQAMTDIDDAEGPGAYSIGRLLADALYPYEMAERGASVWDAADADSSGLEAAWASLLDKDGEFRDEEFEALGEPVVYLYRFALHDDFVQWRMAVMDTFCRMFENNAVILAQYHTTSFSLVQFEELGFRELPETQFAAPSGFPRIDREVRFMVRDNAKTTSFGLEDYPRDLPDATAEHAEWLESRGKWKDLI